jgi:hypothetical protein
VAARLAAKYSELAVREFELNRKAKIARIALHYFPNWGAAWQVLANLYHEEQELSDFFEAASDRIGRLALYKAWRRHALK